MSANLHVLIRRAWRGSSCRLFSPAPWMSDEELEMVAVRVKGCSAAEIHRAVQIAESAFDLMSARNGETLAKESYASEKPTQESRGKLRSLKIESIGDFAYHKVIPRIRISGQWLERAGFKAGHTVELHLLKEGEMTLRFKEKVNALAPEQTQTQTAGINVAR